MKMKITDLPQISRNAKRFEQIVRVLAKYGLAGFIQYSDAGWVRSLLEKASSEEVGELAHLSQPERIRLALTELGTTFIKLGQMLSTRADLVGPAMAKELEKLQANTPADPPEKVREIFEEEIGVLPEQAFAHFEPEAMASASIAQVHRAKLHDGTEVVVKVQHADIVDKVVNDLEILVGLADFVERRSTELSLYQPKATIVEFRKNLMRELDFTLELQNLLQFQRNFEEDATVHIPLAFPDFSAKRVLTMERLDGVSLQKTSLLERQGFDLKLLARRGAHIFIEMIFRDRFYHADPHPGNILALDDNVIGLLDSGMVGHLDSTTRQCFEGLIEGFMTKDVEVLTDYCLRLGAAPPNLDRDRLESDIDLFVTENLTGSLKDLDLGRVLNQFVDIIRSHRIVQRPSIQLLIKVLIMLEGTGRQLDPDFSLSEILNPVYKKAVGEKFSPQSFMRRMKRSYLDWDQLLRAAPRDLADIMKRVRQGTLDVHLEHRKLDAVVNRITYGMLTAALFLGSSLLWSREIPPTIFGASVPGLLGVVVSVFLGYRLILAIHRSGGLGPKR